LGASEQPASNLPPTCLQVWACLEATSAPLTKYCNWEHKLVPTWADWPKLDSSSLYIDATAMAPVEFAHNSYGTPVLNWSASVSTHTVFWLVFLLLGYQDPISSINPQSI